MHNNNRPAPAGSALVLLCGLPGSGKTTFALALARELPFVHLESDAVRRELFPAPGYSVEESARVFAVIEERAARCLSEGRVVLVDATNLREAHRCRFLGLARHAMVPAVTFAWWPRKRPSWLAWQSLAGAIRKQDRRPIAGWAPNRIPAGHPAWSSIPASRSRPASRLSQGW